MRYPNIPLRYHEIPQILRHPSLVSRIHLSVFRRLTRWLSGAELASYTSSSPGRIESPPDPNERPQHFFHSPCGIIMNRGCTRKSTALRNSNDCTIPSTTSRSRSAAPTVSSDVDIESWRRNLKRAVNSHLERDYSYASGSGMFESDDSSERELAFNDDKVSSLYQTPNQPYTRRMSLSQARLYRKRLPEIQSSVAIKCSQSPTRSVSSERKTTKVTPGDAALVRVHTKLIQEIRHRIEDERNELSKVDKEIFRYERCIQLRAKQGLHHGPPALTGADELPQA